MYLRFLTICCEVTQLLCCWSLSSSKISIAGDVKENIGEEVETLFFAVITELQLNYNFHLISTDFQQSAAMWLYMSDADFITPKSQLVEMCWKILRMKMKNCYLSVPTLNHNFQLLSTDFQQSAAKWLDLSDADFITKALFHPNLNWWRCEWKHEMTNTLPCHHWTISMILFPSQQNMNMLFQTNPTCYPWAHPWPTASCKTT